MAGFFSFGPFSTPVGQLIGEYILHKEYPDVLNIMS